MATIPLVDCTHCGAHTFDPHEGYCPSCGYDAVEAMALDHDRNQRIAEEWDDRYE